MTTPSCSAMYLPIMKKGSPGELSMTVMYSLTDDNELKIDYKGTTNKKTIVNMTSHGFFSLAGIGNPTPTCEDVVCQINADFYIPIDEIAFLRVKSAA